MTLLIQFKDVLDSRKQKTTVKILKIFQNNNIQSKDYYYKRNFQKGLSNLPHKLFCQITSENPRLTTYA